VLKVKGIEATVERRVRSLVIDDSREDAQAVSLCFQLRWPNSTVLSALTGDKGLKIAETESLDLVVLDISLPDIDGFEVCRRIRTFSEVPIIMLTGRNRDVDVVRGLELGADDYIIKPFSRIEFLARVQAVLRRAQVLPPGFTEPPFECGDLWIDFNSREVRVKGELVKLTPTEYSLLSHLAENAGRVLTHRTLLAEVWGPEYLNATDCLKVHIQRLRQKLGDTSASRRYIATERGVGYRFLKVSADRASPEPSDRILARL
jgi:two-component system KDP operon response regulator KdpE